MSDQTQTTGLPDYADPPVKEVVLDVHFATIPDYTIETGLAIWGFLKEEYPELQQKNLLLPELENFEQQAFGITPSAAAIEFTNPPNDIRLWFCKENKSQLFQFQHDRLILNWNKNPDLEYSRFENLSSEYYRVLEVINGYLVKSKKEKLQPNHAEIQYVNYIEVGEKANISNWIKGVNFVEQAQSINIASVEDVYGSKTSPVARFYSEVVVAKAINPSGEEKTLLKLTFRFRGPVTGTDGIKYLFEAGHEKIVRTFDEVTTESAHKVWGKK